MKIELDNDVQLAVLLEMFSAFNVDKRMALDLVQDRMDRWGVGSNFGDVAQAVGDVRRAIGEVSR